MTAVVSRIARVECVELTMPPLELTAELKDEHLSWPTEPTRPLAMPRTEFPKLLGAEYTAVNHVRCQERASGLLLLDSVRGRGMRAGPGSNIVSAELKTSNIADLKTRTSSNIVSSDLKTRTSSNIVSAELTAKARQKYDLLSAETSARTEAYIVSADLTAKSPETNNTTAAPPFPHPEDPSVSQLTQH